MATTTVPNTDYILPSSNSACNSIQIEQNIERDPSSSNTTNTTTNDIPERSTKRLSISMAALRIDTSLVDTPTTSTNTTTSNGRFSISSPSISTPKIANNSVYSSEYLADSNSTLQNITAQLRSNNSLNMRNSALLSPITPTLNIPLNQKDSLNQELHRNHIDYQIENGLNLTIPTLVYKCCDFILNNDPIQGTFRLNGSIKKIKKMESKLKDENSSIKDLDFSNIASFDLNDFEDSSITVIDVAMILKRFVNNIDTALINSEVHKSLKDDLQPSFILNDEWKKSTLSFKEKNEIKKATINDNNNNNSSSNNNMTNSSPQLPKTNTANLPNNQLLSTHSDLSALSDGQFSLNSIPSDKTDITSLSDEGENNDDENENENDAVGDDEVAVESEDNEHVHMANDETAASSYTAPTLDPNQRHSLAYSVKTSSNNTISTDSQHNILEVPRKSSLNFKDSENDKDYNHHNHDSDDVDGVSPFSSISSESLSPYEYYIVKICHHLSKLPIENLNLLVYLLKFLNEFSKEKYVDITKMTSSNLAKVFHLSFFSSDDINVFYGQGSSISAPPTPSSSTEDLLNNYKINERLLSFWIESYDTIYENLKQTLIDRKDELSKILSEPPIGPHSSQFKTQANYDFLNAQKSNSFNAEKQAKQTRRKSVFGYLTRSTSGFVNNNNNNSNNANHSTSSLMFNNNYSMGNLTSLGADKNNHSTYSLPNGNSSTHSFRSIRRVSSSTGKDNESVKNSELNYDNAKRIVSDSSAVSGGSKKSSFKFGTGNSGLIPSSSSSFNFNASSNNNNNNGTRLTSSSTTNRLSFFSSDEVNEDNSTGNNSSNKIKRRSFGWFNSNASAPNLSSTNNDRSSKRRSSDAQNLKNKISHPVNVSTESLTKESTNHSFAHSHSYSYSHSHSQSHANNKLSIHNNGSVSSIIESSVLDTSKNPEGFDDLKDHSNKTITVHKRNKSESLANIFSKSKQKGGNRSESFSHENGAIIESRDIEQQKAKRYSTPVSLNSTHTSNRRSVSTSTLITPSSGSDHTIKDQHQEYAPLYPPSRVHHKTSRSVSNPVSSSRPKQHPELHHHNLKHLDEDVEPSAKSNSAISTSAAFNMLKKVQPAQNKKHRLSKFFANLKN
ncbi:hypothetical protein BVG19_g5425 [[Candida] boidinii]|nr:hypothetical protein BVG19_g5425 [[Candida] boidinii]OWB48538.1 hypothetical protein B5S27_g73 [[Candida] boidinii]